MTTLYLQDENFKSLGAIAYHDSHYPINNTPYDGRGGGGGLFSRHYFDHTGMEIGLVIPYLFSVDMGVQVFDTKRVWGDVSTTPLR